MNKKIAPGHARPLCAWRLMRRLCAPVLFGMIARSCSPTRSSGAGDSFGEGFQHFLFTDAAASDFYRPMQRLSYLVDYAAFFLLAGRLSSGQHSLARGGGGGAVLFRGRVARASAEWNRRGEHGWRFSPRSSGWCIRCKARRSLTFPGARIRWRRRLVYSRSSLACACCGRRERANGCSDLARAFVCSRAR